MGRIISAALALVVVSLGPTPAGAAPPKRAADFTFDGFRLGDEYAAKVMSRAPYDQPCDDDPIDKKARRFMVYGALPAATARSPTRRP